jgi:hypothetical protein
VSKVYEATVLEGNALRRTACLALGRLPPGDDGYREQSAAAHDLLACLAEQALGEAAGALVVRKASTGRPVLFRAERPLKNVCVSIAHSRRWVAVGLAREGRLGVDVEQEKPGRRIVAMADWLGWTGCDTPEAFYRAWTYREAHIKCRDGKVPSPEAETFPASAPVGRARHHAFYALVATGVHGCAVLETPVPVRVEWRAIDPAHVAAWS